MSLKFDPELEQPVKTMLETLTAFKATGAAPFHLQAELVQQSGMTEFQANTDLLVEAAEQFLDKSMSELIEALEKFLKNQQQMKASLSLI